MAAADYDLEERATAERVELDAVLAGWREKYPQVEVAVDVVTGPAGRVMVGATRGAQLMVVGLPRPRRFPRAAARLDQPTTAAPRPLPGRGGPRAARGRHLKHTTGPPFEHDGLGDEKRRRPDMTAMKRWNVEILIGEEDHRTYAEAQLHDEIRDNLVGTGQARLHPAEPGTSPRSATRSPWPGPSRIWDADCWSPPPATWRRPRTTA